MFCLGGFQRKTENVDKQISVSNPWVHTVKG